jgi:hypothetical protein
MVYRTRNKAFEVFSTTQANPRVAIPKKAKLGSDLSKCVTIQVNQTRFDTMRRAHGYRNISRATKQFLMGDQVMEQISILVLKNYFMRPMQYKSPIYLTYYFVSFSTIFHLIIISIGTLPC